VLINYAQLHTVQYTRCYKLSECVLLAKLHVKICCIATIYQQSEKKQTTVWCLLANMQHHRKMFSTDISPEHDMPHGSLISNDDHNHHHHHMAKMLLTYTLTKCAHKTWALRSAILTMPRINGWHNFIFSAPEDLFYTSNESTIHKLNNCNCNMTTFLLLLIW